MDKESKPEEEILASFERGEWQPVLKLESEIARFAVIASASLVKNKRVNIRISSRDFDDIQANAAEEVISYPPLPLVGEGQGRGKYRNGATDLCLNGIEL